MMHGSARAASAVSDVLFQAASNDFNVDSFKRNYNFTSTLAAYTLAHPVTGATVATFADFRPFNEESNQVPLFTDPNFMNKLPRNLTGNIFANVTGETLSGMFKTRAFPLMFNQSSSLIVPISEAYGSFLGNSVPVILSGYISDTTNSR